MRTLLRLAYDGAPFCGWQIQPKERTVQGDLDDALSTLLRQPIQTMGAGRTDTGVHAKEMFVHFDWAPELGKGIQDLDQLVHRLNRFLDPAIRIYEAREVQPDWHARFDATARSYEYILCASGSPFRREKAWMVERLPDILKMNAGSRITSYGDGFLKFLQNWIRQQNHHLRRHSCRVGNGRRRFDFLHHRRPFPP
jgi:tRNA pseudouridine38-40 synthase